MSCQHQSLENSTLKVAQDSHPTDSLGSFKPWEKGVGEKYNRWCDYCHKSRHMKETCWKLNGKRPFGNKGNKLPFKKACQSVTSKNLEPGSATQSLWKASFTKDQLKLLYKMMRHHQLILSLHNYIISTQPLMFLTSLHLNPGSLIQGL